MIEDWGNQAAQCACGAFHLIAHAPPSNVLACHCKDCQRRTGSAFGVGCIFDRGSLDYVDGALSTYDRISDAGGVVRHFFCANCATTVLWVAKRFPSLVVVAGGIFDDTTWIKPKFSVWSKSSQHWLDQASTLPAYATTPWEND